MKEVEILKETVSQSKPKEFKKRTYKPRKKKETKQEEFTGLEHEMVQRSSEIHSIKKPIQAGSYKIGKSFHVFFEEKPKSIHRFFTKLFLGWEWKDQK
jgi:hypothetical protein